MNYNLFYYLLNQFEELESMSIRCSSKEDTANLERSIEFGEVSINLGMKKRAQLRLSPKLLSALDKCEISNRYAIHIL